MLYTIVNPEDIPENLPVGKYTLEIVSMTWGELKLKYIGEVYDPSNPQCLVQLSITSTNG